MLDCVFELMAAGARGGVEILTVAQSFSPGLNSSRVGSFVCVVKK
jgi:hypothetical protein